MAPKLKKVAAVAVAINCSSLIFAFTPIAPVVNDFGVKKNRYMTKLSATALPIPKTDALNEVQPELGPDDLYIEKNNKVPKVGEVMRMLPKETFQIDTVTGLFYFAVDFLAVATTMGFLNAVVTSDLYHSFPIWAQALSVAPLQVLTGFAMWCMWCIGHDAGHNTVSKSKSVNRVIGEIAHSMVCLTPFVPWAKSHKKHHLNHNHLTKGKETKFIIS